MKVLSAHHCTRAHRTWKAFAKCAWPNALRIEGEGPYASVSHCVRSEPRFRNKGPWIIYLYPELADAENAKATIDGLACGGECRGASSHEVVELRK